MAIHESKRLRDAFMSDRIAERGEWNNGNPIL